MNGTYVWKDGVDWISLLELYVLLKGNTHCNSCMHVELVLNAVTFCYFV